jgi:recombination protein RecT
MATNPTLSKETKKDIRALIQSEAVRAQIAMVLPRHLTAERMARVACTAILKTPALANCSPESLLQALMLCSQAGLEPDGRNAHLIPFKDQVQVIFDYKGLVALAERNGVECIYADKVCEADEFDAWVEAGEKKLHHRVNWRKPRGEAFAYYASCRRNNRLDYEVMTREEVESIRKRSRAANNGPWVTDFDEMGKKTTLRRMSKRWDLNPEIADVINADDDTPPGIHHAVVASKPLFTPQIAEKAAAPEDNLPMESPPTKPAEPPAEKK